MMQNKGISYVLAREDTDVKELNLSYRPQSPGNPPDVI